MRTAVVLFTRDLRVHDHPALAAACAAAEQVVPLFVLDDRILRSPLASPNKLVFLRNALADLDASLKDRGGALWLRRGDVAAEVAAVCRDARATAVYCSADGSGYAHRRLQRLRDAVGDAAVHALPGTAVHPPGSITTGHGGSYQRFTPYWRSWRETSRRPVLEPPEAVRVPRRPSRGRVPPLRDLTGGTPSPELPVGGERPARALLASWIESGVEAYEDDQDDLAGDATSRLSPYLHLGCLSPVELVDAVAARPASGGAEAFVRQLCWRDFHLHVLAGAPQAAWRDWRDRGDRWRNDPRGLQAWQQGRTGVPIVDAGMRQLRREGWLPNRARLIVASFLTRDLYVDWRAGARYFLDWLVDGDLASNQLNWQWVAGTGTVSRPNRALSPLRQAQRFDPHGDYVRRHVPELAGVRGTAVHALWSLPPEQRAALDYPEPIIDHDEAMARFRAARGIDA